MRANYRKLFNRSRHRRRPRRVRLPFSTQNSSGGFHLEEVHAFRQLGEYSVAASGHRRHLRVLRASRCPLAAGFRRYIGQCSFWDTYSATLMGFASIFLFARVGEPVRPLLIAQKSNTPVAGMFGIWVLERAFDFAAALLLFSISLLIFPHSLFDSGASGEWVAKARTGGWLLVILLGGLVFGLAYFRLHGAGTLHRRLEGWRAASGWRKSVAGAIGGFSEGLQAIRTIPDLMMAIFYTAIHWGPGRCYSSTRWSSAHLVTRFRSP